MKTFIRLFAVGNRSAETWHKTGFYKPIEPFRCNKSINWALKVWLFLSLFVALGSGFSANSQSVIQQESYWIRAYLQVKRNKRWTFHWEADERRLIRPDRQLQLITHAHFHRILTKRSEIAAGASFSLVNDVFETRLFQEFHWAIPINSRFRISNRLRSEQRWFWEPEVTGELKYRWRYRVLASYSISTSWVIKGSEEIMIQGTEFDQNRIYTALEYRFSKRIGLEAGYLKIYPKRRPSVFVNSDILRTTLYFYVQTI